jgi:aldose 1-epimerase
MVIAAGELSATFLPDLGMTGVSLLHRGREHLALPGGLPALRAGDTLGLPLLAPWANRLATWGYCACGIDVDLDGLPLHTDGHGLPIHGLLVGRPGWRVEGCSAGGGRARLRAAIDVDSPAFPFPHRIELVVSVHDDRLAIDTRVVPTSPCDVPIAFGWHPYLRVPGTPRGRWRLRLPARTHLTVDERGIPTGDERAERHEAGPIGRRTFDDLYALDRDRTLALEADDSAIELHVGAGYPCAQVWVPAGRPFAALEPMTARTNCLVHGPAPIVRPGDAYTATFALAVHDPGS